MDSIILSVLQYLYHKTEKGGFVPLYNMEVEFAISGAKLQAYLEDLKESELVVEATEGFQISGKGILFAKTRWV